MWFIIWLIRFLNCIKSITSFFIRSLKDSCWSIIWWCYGWNSNFMYTCSYIWRCSIEIINNSRLRSLYSWFHDWDSLLFAKRVCSFNRLKVPSWKRMVCKNGFDSFSATNTGTYVRCQLVPHPSFVSEQSFYFFCNPIFWHYTNI